MVSCLQRLLCLARGHAECAGARIQAGLLRDVVPFQSVQLGVGWTAVVNHCCDHYHPDNYAVDSHVASGRLRHSDHVFPLTHRPSDKLSDLHTRARSFVSVLQVHRSLKHVQICR